MLNIEDRGYVYLVLDKVDTVKRTWSDDHCVYAILIYIPSSKYANHMVKENQGNPCVAVCHHPW